VNNHLWEGGHFHKNEGKALKQRRGGARRVHFGKDSQVYLGPLFVRVISKITFIRDSVWSVLIAIFVPLKLTFKKKRNIVLWRQTNVTRFLDEDGRGSPRDFTRSFCQDPRFIIAMIRLTWPARKKTHGVMIRWRQERVKFCKSRVARTDVIFIQVSVTQCRIIYAHGSVVYYSL